MSRIHRVKSEGGRCEELCPQASEENWIPIRILQPDRLYSTLMFHGFLWTHVRPQNTSVQCTVCQDTMEGCAPLKQGCKSKKNWMLEQKRRNPTKEKCPRRWWRGVLEEKLCSRQHDRLKPGSRPCGLRRSMSAGQRGSDGWPSGGLTSLEELLLELEIVQRKWKS